MCQSQREYSCQYEMLKNIFLDYIYFQALTSILTNFPVIHLFSSLVFLYSMKNMCVHMINSFPSPWPLNLLFSCLDPFMILPLSISPYGKITPSTVPLQSVCLLVNLFVYTIQHLYMKLLVFPLNQFSLQFFQSLLLYSTVRGP